MLAEPVDLARCTGVEFCLHHPERCKIAAGACPDHGLEGWEGGALFVAALVSRRIDARKLKLTKTEGGVAKARGSLRDAWYGISRRLSRQGFVFTGAIAAGSEPANAIAVSVLGAIAARNDGQIATLSGLFASEDDLINEVASAIESYFEIDAAFPLSRD